jgi:hypothetical protein
MSASEPATDSVVELPFVRRVWLASEQKYLEKMSVTCKRLTDKFKLIHRRYNRYQGRFRIPSIILSSVTGLFSMGNSNFPAGYQQYVSIGVGIVSVAIAVLGSIESFMKIGDIMAYCMQAATTFHKLKEKIDCELALPVGDRKCDGITFVRECSVDYHKAFAVGGNLIKSDWFIDPEYQHEEFNVHTADATVIPMSPTNNTNSTNSTNTNNTNTNSTNNITTAAETQA